MSVTLYVYYKVSFSDKTSCLSAVKNLDPMMKAQFPDVKVELQKRVNVDAENRETWMETYAGIPELVLEKFIAELTALAEKIGLPKERKNEAFIAL